MQTTLTSSYADVNTLSILDISVDLEGDLLTADHPDYDAVRRVWNGAVDSYPELIIRCRSSHDVATGMRFAIAADLPISVRSGGHNSAGLAVADGGLMLDLAQMKGLTINHDTLTVRAEPGLTLGEIVPALAAHGLVAVTGTCAGTGLGGSTLGGGIGWLSGRFGMGIDNLLAAEIVTADGAIRRIDASNEPELFWAVRGGGGNFGVVTAFEFRVHRLEYVLGGMLVYPLAEAAAALHHYRELRAVAGDELSALLVFATFPGVGAALMIQLCYSGPDLIAGTELLAPLRKALVPALDTIQPMRYADFFMAYTPPVPDGRRYYETACPLDSLSDEAIAVLRASAMRLPNNTSSIVIHELHGVAAHVDPSATAFALRYPHLMVLHAAGWEDMQHEAGVHWAERSYEALAPHATQGLYVNFMNAGSEDEVRAAYKDNYARLAAIKAVYDPQNRFRLNQNIKPAERS